MVATAGYRPGVGNCRVSVSTLWSVAVIPGVNRGKLHIQGMGVAGLLPIISGTPSSLLYDVLGEGQFVIIDGKMIRAQHRGRGVFFKPDES